MRVIKAHCQRAKETIQIDQAMTGSGVVQIGPAAFFQLDDDFKTVQQDMLLELMQHMRGVNVISFFAPNRAALRSRRRLGEDRWDTHLSIIAVVPSLVNRRRAFTGCPWGESERDW